MKYDDLILERSDDPARGSMPHLARTISQVRGLATATPCGRCGQRASHLIDTRNTPRAVCGGCARLWSRLTVEQRGAKRAEFARHGGLR